MMLLAAAAAAAAAALNAILVIIVMQPRTAAVSAAPSALRNRNSTKAETMFHAVMQPRTAAVSAAPSALPKRNSTEAETMFHAVMQLRTAAVSAAPSALPKRNSTEAESATHSLARLQNSFAANADPCSLHDNGLSKYKTAVDSSSSSISKRRKSAAAYAGSSADNENTAPAVDPSQQGSGEYVDTITSFFSKVVSLLGLPPHPPANKYHPHPSLPVPSPPPLPTLLLPISSVLTRPSLQPFTSRPPSVFFRPIFSTNICSQAQPPTLTQQKRKNECEISRCSRFPAVAVRGGCRALRPKNHRRCSVGAAAEEQQASARRVTYCSHFASHSGARSVLLAFCSQFSRITTDDETAGNLGC
jgi:hypothetical protein